MQELKDKGFDIAVRSAGSHSPIDVFGINIKEGKILLIQSKPDNFGKTASKRIHDKWDKLNKPYNVYFKLV